MKRLRLAGDPAVIEGLVVAGRVPMHGADGATHDVVVVGSINRDLRVVVDRLPGPGETIIARGGAWHAGGKGANQAVAATRDGARAQLVGAIGLDAGGADALAELASVGVDISAITRSSRPTGMAVVTVDRHGENQITVLPGANDDVDASHVWSALLSTGRTGGTTCVCLVSLEIPDEAIVAAAKAAQRSGRRLIVNPAPARPLAREVLAAHPILTPNVPELMTLAAWTGSPDARAIHTAAERIVARTRAPVVVTLGAAGCLVVDAAGSERIDGFVVDALDTTGAGDAFNGVLASSLARGMNLRDAARRACAAGAVVATSVGARSNGLSAAIVDRLVAGGIVQSRESSGQAGS